jgi:isopenicillin N synthase-like dioxygenase
LIADRKYAAEYLTNVRRVEITLLGAISESLGLERDYIEKKLGGHYASLNYYGACEQSDLELTYGVRAHTDPTIITILLQDDVPGLQVLSEGKWMDVNPIPGTVVVHVGDLLQVIIYIFSYIYSTLKLGFLNCY